jgi:large subunit ribosomal protein L27e
VPARLTAPLPLLRPTTTTVAGINRYPRKITKAQSKEVSGKRKRIKAFLRTINVNHLMPTRYELTDVDLKGLADTTSKEPAARKEKLLQLKGEFEKRFTAQGTKAIKANKHTNDAAYFFRKLRF